MGAPKSKKFGDVLLWSGDPEVDFLEVRGKHDALRAKLRREEGNLLDRLYDWLDFPREYRGAGWIHDPQPQKTKKTFPLSKQDAWIAVRAMVESIKLTKESNRLHERDERIVRALLSQDSNSLKIKEICEGMRIVRSNRSNPHNATDLYMKLTNGSEGLRVAYELPPGCADLSQALRRDLPHETPLSNEEAADVLAEWFDVPYETIRTWLKRELKRRQDHSIKIPLSDERRKA